MANRPKFVADDYEDRLRDLAAEGKTCTGAATALAIHYKATKRMADELGITFQSGGKGRSTPWTQFERRLQERIRRELALDPMDR